MAGSSSGLHLFGIVALALLASAAGCVKTFVHLEEALHRTASLSTFKWMFRSEMTTATRGVRFSLGPDFVGTVFAPTDNAMMAFRASDKDDYTFTQFMNYHISDRYVDEYEFHPKYPEEVEMLSGTTVTLSRRPGSTISYVKGLNNTEPSTITRRIKAGRAIIYMINKVLIPSVWLPPDSRTPTPEPDGTPNPDRGTPVPEPDGRG